MTGTDTPRLDSKDRIIVAAADLLRAHGPEGASARAVCARAGVTAPTLYHHFGDMAGLYRRVVERAFAEATRRKAAWPSSDGPLADLRHGWDSYVGFAADEPALFAVMNREIVSGTLPPTAQAAYATLVESVRRLARIRPLRLDTETGALMLWAAAHGVACISCAGLTSPENSAELNRSLWEATIATLLDDRTDSSV